jgi:hypothetical protein
VISVRWFVLSLLLAACGGKATASEWAGSWRTTPAPPGSYVAMTLSGSGTAVSGSGTQYREAGMPTTFTVSGDLGETPAGSVKFTYPDNSTESFSYSQPDANRLTLANSVRTLNFNRQYAVPVRRDLAAVGHLEADGEQHLLSRISVQHRELGALGHAGRRLASLNPRRL